MSAEIHTIRPRIVMSVGRDGSLSFAATSDGPWHRSLGHAQ